MGVGSLHVVRIGSLTSMRDNHGGVIGHAVDTRLDFAVQRVA